ncbi:MAG: hypothetical protein U1F52_16915 [Burkholderiales bacterium]
MSEKKRINLDVDIQVVPDVDGALALAGTGRVVKPGPRAAFRVAEPSGNAGRREWHLMPGNRR